MAIRLAITVLCGVGLYASLFMLAKSRRAERGELNEPSVVQTPRARLFGGVPNAAIGIAYYSALTAAIWFAHAPLVWAAILAAVAFAAIVSIVLAYSLLLVTRMPCPYCWTSHTVNWMLVPMTWTLVNLSYWH